MPPKIFPKALIVSNIAHWCFVVSSLVMVMMLYLAGATFASDGTSSLKAIFAEMQSSVTLGYAAAFATIMATIPAGYIAARMAPRDQLLNGTLSTSGWLLFCVYDAIWGIAGDSKIHLPYWMDLLTSYGLILPALAGAYIWQRRATTSHPPAQVDIGAPAGMQHQSDMATVPDGSTSAHKRRTTRAATGLGIFIVIVSNILLTKHEQHVMFLGLLALIALMLVAAFAAKALRNLRHSA
jgi:hypothetical protein